MSIVRKNQKKLQEAVAFLQKKDQPSVSAAVNILKDHGHPTVLSEVFKSLEGLERAEQQLILGFLADIQDTDAVEAFINYLQEETNPANRKLVLSAIWNSKLPFDEHLPFFVMLASQGDFLEALDCLTIIENMSGPFDESQLLESQLLLKEYVEERAPQTDQKAQIMSEIAWFVKEQNDGIDADLLIDND
ncbi:MAG: hypothetical protein RL331_801 [Bacteroidota bacterium]|jgi:hypothetical protein|nr:hypothetical protein [Crocinitomicaceae bacterium]